MRLLLVGASLLLAAASAVDRGELKALRPCFERYPNHKLIGMKSYHSEFRMQSEEECLHFCALTATRCRSIVYDSAQHLCHFFLDDGAEQAEFAPRMIYFRVTAKRCLEDTVKKLPDEKQALPTTTEQPQEPEFKSPVVARKRGGKLAKRKQIDSADLTTTTTTTTTTTPAPPTLEDMGMKEAMDDLLDDIERNTEAFENEQRKEKRARDDDEREELRIIKEQIRKKLKEKIEALRENFPDMYEELMGREAEYEEVAEAPTTTTTTQRPVNDGEIPFRRKKVARAPEKEVTTQANLVANDDDHAVKSENLGPLVSEDEGKPAEKKFLAIPDMHSEEIEYEDQPLPSRKVVSEIRKSPKRIDAKQDSKKIELKKNTLSKAELFAQQLSGSTTESDMPATTTPLPTTTTTRAARTAYTRRAVMTRRIITTTTTEAPEPIEIEQATESPQFSIKTRPVVDDETAAADAVVTGCIEDEVPLWVRFENSEPDMDAPKASAPMDNRDACQNACNEVDGARSITFSEKDNSCQCNVDFDGISMRKSAVDDFSVSTSTRFCFAKSLEVFKHCGAFMGFRDFTLNVDSREQFDGLPPSYEGLQLCIELCSLSTDYACKSATFDFENGRCALNDVDSSSNPTDFAPTLVDHLLYFENSCERAEVVLQKDSAAPSMNVDRVAASDAAKFSSASSSGSGIGGLKVRPISRDTYSLKEASAFRMH